MAEVCAQHGRWGAPHDGWCAAWQVACAHPATRRYVADSALLGVLERILDASPSDGGVDLPIGNLTSQIVANLYLNDIDHWLTGEPAGGACLRCQQHDVESQQQ